MGLFSGNPKKDADDAKDYAHSAASNYYAIHAELSKIAEELDMIERLLKPGSKGHSLSGMKRMMRAHKHSSAKMAHALGETRLHLHRIAEKIKASRL